MTVVVNGGPADARSARLRLRSQVAQAARILTPTWPITTFIAVNPLGGLENRPFADATRLAGELFGARGALPETAFRAAYREGRVTDRDLTAALRRLDLLGGTSLRFGAGSMTPDQLWLADLLHGTPAPGPRRRTATRSTREAPKLADTVDAQTTKWCAAFLDTGQAAWAMPGRRLGFYCAWRELAHRDRTLTRPVRSRLGSLPAHGEDACLAALDALAISQPDRVDYLQAHLTQLPGWAAHVRWRAEQTPQHEPGQPDGRIDLVDYLAVRLSYEAALLTDHPCATEGAVVPSQQVETADRRARRVAEVLDVQASESQLAVAAQVLGRLPVEQRELLWLDAYEGHYRDDLLAQLTRRASVGAPSRGRPAAQLICCIDARSEGLRRHVETVGHYETLGFAGFFAVAIRYRELAGGMPSALCPALIQPRNDITELPAPDAPARAARQLAGRRALAGAETAFHTAKDGPASPFALAEAAGWAAGPLAAAKTLVPGATGALRSHLHRRAAPPAPTTLTVTDGFTADERVLFATAALTMMGLHAGFGRLVVLCGHGSTTENNPYAAALDCGACGGNRGAPNARTAAVILNGQDVRTRLAEAGIVIPSDTWFVAAEHDTARDRVDLLDRHLVPPTHLTELDQLAADLAIAGARLSAERCASLPGAPTRRTPRTARRHVRSRSSDWAQVYPEWGLAGNAAFIIGPRAMTAGLDLHRRTFLHSYDAALDGDGAALETILTAPLVVAQWINCQYYFSTVDPTTFGSGTKTIHNVVGGIGVLSGHNGDLRPGLPWQSVAVGSRLVHEPMRLLAVVQAPLDRIGDIVDRNTVLTQLIGNDWISLAARERPTDPWFRHTPHGWMSWTTPEDTR
ncbi:MAG: DUF2309 domain-containing protein [Frankiales bacterium]|nr:DUF2309 domain-containing protein [Frankiales bacterium]